MKENNYWRKVTPRGRAEVGQLCIGMCEPKLLDIIECVENAGIPRKHWNKIEKVLDYSTCYYEHDTPDTVWRFPLSVFDK